MSIDTPDIRPRFRASLFAKVAFCMLAISAACAAPAPQAFADDSDSSSLLAVRQSEIEMLEYAHKEAESRVLEAKARVAENQAKIDDVMRKLPSQQARTDTALRELYLMEDNRLMYVEMILGAESFDDFIQRIDYFERVSKKNISELNKLNDMLAELKEARIALDDAQAEADEQAELAKAALTLAQDERANKQRAGQASALAQDGNSAILDGANWYATEEEFVAEWAPRIDAYFDGTPMAGTGEIFAVMSFRYCVDPRWSPAISNTESGKGRVCIRPYNAWGWGAADSDPYNLALEWSSWEEAIETHIRGLANGYGYTISVSAAEKYCSTPESWYANTLSEMARI